MTKHHPDLFWALHGGGGNFGVATSFHLQLHPVGPIVQAGILGWPAARAEEVARALRDWAASAPDELGTGLLMLAAPAEDCIPEHVRDQRVVGLAVVWAGHPDEGAGYCAAMRALDPEVDLLMPMPYAEFQRMVDDPRGFRYYWSADYHGQLSDEAVAT